MLDSNDIVLAQRDGRATTLTAGGIRSRHGDPPPLALRDIKAKRTKLSPDKFLKPSPHKRRKSGHAGRSESGQNRKLARLNGMSGLPPKADIRRMGRHVRFVPILLQKSVETGREA